MSNTIPAASPSPEQSPSHRSMHSSCPLVIGILGGIASGKSWVTKRLVDAGGVSFSADQVAHEILDQPAVAERIVKLIGPECLSEDGRIDRKKLAAIVFESTPKGHRALKELEEILHPEVKKEAFMAIELFRSSSQPSMSTEQKASGLLIVDAPLLLEAGWSDMCDRLLFVDTPDEKRFDFALQRGWTLEELRKRESRQWPIEKKRMAATDILINHGDIHDLDQQIQFFLSGLRKA